MKTSSSPVAGCRSCRYYTPEGRRGGSCQQLGVLVKGSWKACSLAIPTFAPSWDFEELMSWQREALEAEMITPVDAAACSHAALPQNNVTPAEITVKKLHTSAREAS